MRRRSRIASAVVAGTVFLLGLLMGAMPAARAGGSGCHGGPFVDQDGLSVDLKGACFIPAVLRVQPGQTITWTNSDDLTHTVTGVAESWGDYEELTLGESVTYRFASSGVFPYFCMLHPGMTGTVVVGDGTSSKTTTQAAVLVVPPTVPPSVAAPVQAVTEGVSSAWRTAAIVGFGALFAIALTALARIRWFRRRRAVAGV